MFNPNLMTDLGLIPCTRVMCIAAHHTCTGFMIIHSWE